MKKIFVLLATAAIFAGCSKEEEKYCWSCVTTVTQKVTGSSPTSGTSNSTICDQTEAEIRNAETTASSTATSTVSGYTATITTTMKCSKKN